MIRPAKARRLRVVQLIGSMLTPLGGAEQYCLELSRTLRDSGHDVTIVTGWISPQLADDLAAEGIAVRLVTTRRPYPPDRKGSRPGALLFHALDLLDSVRTPAPLRRVLAEPWDVVHAHRVAGLGAAALRSTPAPVVLTVHDYSLVDTSTTLLRHGIEAERAPLVQRLRTHLMNHAVRRVRFVFPTERLLQKHRAWGLRVPPHSLVIPHGWRIAAGQPAPVASVDARTAPLVFLFLGKLLPAKGVELLLAAWGTGIPGAELWVAGAGPLDGVVAAAASTGRLRRLGWLDDTARRTALAAASVLVVPSVWPENFPLSAAEGVLAGLPVLSTTVAAPPVVVEGQTGLLVAPDAAALRAGMMRLVDPDLRHRLAAGARAAAHELDFDHHAARLVELYRELVASKTAHRASATSGRRA